MEEDDPNESEDDTGEGADREGGSDSSRPRKRTAAEAALYNKQRWDEMFERLKAFKAKHCHCRVPNRYKEDPQLGNWVSTQRRQYRVLTTGGNQSVPLTLERARLLMEVGFEWNAKDPTMKPWDARFQELLKFKEKYGHTQVAMGWKENPKLGTWVSTQRQEYKQLLQGHSSRINWDKVEKLNKIGFVWEAPRGRRRLESTTSRPSTAGQRGDEIRQTEQAASHSGDVASTSLQDNPNSLDLQNQNLVESTELSNRRPIRHSEQDMSRLQAWLKHQQQLANYRVSSDRSNSDQLFSQIRSLLNQRSNVLRTMQSSTLASSQQNISFPFPFTQTQPQARGASTSLTNDMLLRLSERHSQSRSSTTGQASARTTTTGHSVEPRSSPDGDSLNQLISALMSAQGSDRASYDNGSGSHTTALPRGASTNNNTDEALAHLQARGINNLYTELIRSIICGANSTGDGDTGVSSSSSFPWANQQSRQADMSLVTAFLAAISAKRPQNQAPAAASSSGGQQAYPEVLASVRRDEALLQLIGENQTRQSHPPPLSSFLQQRNNTDPLILALSQFMSQQNTTTGLGSRSGANQAAMTQLETGNTSSAYAAAALDRVLQGQGRTYQETQPRQDRRSNEEESNQRKDGEHPTKKSRNEH